MLSFNATETPPSEVAPKPPEAVPKPRKRWLIVAVVVIVIVVVAGGFAYWWLSRPPPQASWLFKGAYAEYAGQTKVLTVLVNSTMRLEVVEYNSTHAKLLMYMKMESSVMAPVEWQNTTWTDLRTASYEVEGYDLAYMHEGDVYIEGLGTKHCMIFKYTSPDMTMMYYVDKETEWPLKIEFTVTEDSMSMDFDLTLKETNIPGL